MSMGKKVSGKHSSSGHTDIDRASEANVMKFDFKSTHEFRVCLEIDKVYEKTRKLG